MAYETGAAATVDAVLQKISTFALGLGYTINRDTTWASGRELSIYHVDAGYFNFQSDNTIDDWSSGWPSDPKPWISQWGSTGYDASAIDAQPGTSPLCKSNGLPPDFHKYHLFGTTEYIHCVIEIQPGLFAHLGCGKLDKAWAYDGGEYVYGTVWHHSSTYIHKTLELRNHGPFDSYAFSGDVGGSIGGCFVRCDLEGVSPRWFGFESGPQTAEKAVGVGNSGEVNTNTTVYTLFGGWWNLLGPSTVNGIAPLMPSYVGVNTATTQKAYLIGTVKDFRHTNVALTSPSQVITYGTDDWVIFPLKKKHLDTVSFPEYSSGVEGIAYRKV